MLLGYRPEAGIRRQRDRDAGRLARSSRSGKQGRSGSDRASARETGRGREANTLCQIPPRGWV